jgi:hypothetical protein
VSKQSTACTKERARCNKCQRKGQVPKIYNAPNRGIWVAGAEFHANGESDRSRISDPDLVCSGDGPRPDSSPHLAEVADHTLTSKTTTSDKLPCSPLTERRRRDHRLACLIQQPCSTFVEKGHIASSRAPWRSGSFNFHDEKSLTVTGNSRVHLRFKFDAVPLQCR